MFLIVGDEALDISNFVPKRVSEAINDALEEGLFDHSFTEDEWEIKGISQIDKLLRLKIWSMLEECARENKKLVVMKAIQGVISLSGFYKALKNPLRAAYIFTRPLDLHNESLLLLEMANTELKRILTLPLLNLKGEANVGVINAKIRIANNIRDRVEGQSIQRVQQHNINEVKSLPPQKEDSLEQIDAQIKELGEGSTEIREVNVFK